MPIVTIRVKFCPIVFNCRFVPCSRHHNSSSLRINTLFYIRKKSLILQTNTNHLVART